MASYTEGKRRITVSKQAMARRRAGSSIARGGLTALLLQTFQAGAGN